MLLRTWLARRATPAPIAHLALTREHSGRRAFWLDVLAAMSRARPELTGLAAPARGSRTLAGCAPGSTASMLR